MSDWSPVARSTELCELWCSLTAAFSWKASLWGLQVFNTLIYTSKQHRKGIVLKGGEGLQKEGGQGNEGCFIFSFFPSGVGRGLSL